MLDDHRPRLVCLPAWDSTFVDDVDAVIASDVPTRTAAELQDTLRPRYPHIVVRPSVLDGLRTPTWYVYRDGHFPWSE